MSNHEEESEFGGVALGRVKPAAPAVRTVGLGRAGGIAKPVPVALGRVSTIVKPAAPVTTVALGRVPTVVKPAMPAAPVALGRVPTVTKPVALGRVPIQVPAAVVASPAAEAASRVVQASHVAALQQAAKPVVPVSVPIAKPAVTPTAPVTSAAPADLPSYPWPEAALPASSTVPDDSPAKPAEQMAISDTNMDVSSVEPVIKVETATQPVFTFWDKILNYLGLARKVTSKPTMHGESSISFDTLKQAAESVVRRVRSGDQNAMAMMAMVRDNVASGNTDAKISLHFMKMYIERNPIGGVGVQVGSEYDEGIRWELGE